MPIPPTGLAPMTTSDDLPNQIAMPLPPPPGLGSTIRNISQTAQERTIIKTCPDLVVYLEGFPYMPNYFVSDPETNNPYTIVQFNNYVTTFNAGYDTDTLIPQASITLQVPAHDAHLFQMPGGNNLFQTMMQVQVYAKGYFFGNDGSTLFRRVFKGLVSHISQSFDGTMLSLQLQCYGILHFLELMQVELAPAVVSNAPMPTVPFKTNLAYCNPYLMIVDMFIRRLTTEGFSVSSVNNADPAFSAKINDPRNAYNQAVNSGYIPKWQAILDGVKKDVHFYGLTYKDIANLDPSNLTNPSLVKNKEDMVTKGSDGDRTNAQTDAAQIGDKAQVASPENQNLANASASSYETQPAIRQYLPDMSVSSIQLLNNKIVNRIDEVRQVLQTIMYEGYQDVDGKVIFKPPLYNLDVANDNIGTATDLSPAASSGTAGSTAANTGTTANSGGQPLISSPSSGTPASPRAGLQKPDPITTINASNNPFVIYLDEIISEEESEDQAAIKTTRMTLRGNWEPSWQVTGHEECLETVQYIDMSKLRQFGLREVPTKQVGWFRGGDKYGLFAYAAAETTRSNRGYRTYTVTIPMRPELKLGFPCFIPHRDMYGYIKSIQLQYNQGGAATMTVSMDTIRRRPMLPQPQNSTNANGAQGNSSMVWVSQPNLVYQWSMPPASSTSTSQENPLGTVSVLGDSIQVGTAFNPNASSPTPLQPSPNSPANIVGTPASNPLTPDQAPSSQQIAVLAAAQSRVASTWGTEPDSINGACWYIQNDTYGRYTITGPSEGNYGQPNVPVGGVKGVFTKQRIVDSGYYADVRRTMPFTDAKGYEVASPFPWGRYITLYQAFNEFTLNGYIVPATKQPTADAFVPSDAVQALLAAGLTAPSGSGAVEQLQTAMNTPGSASGITSGNNDFTIIVLKYTTSPSDSQLLQNAQPDVQSAITQLTGTITTQQQAISVLVSGGTAPTLATLQALKAQTPDPNANLGLTHGASAKPVNDIYPVSKQGIS